MLARDLITRLPNTADALELGTIDLPRAKAMHDYTEPLGNEQAAEVDKRVLDNSPPDNLTKFKRGLHGEVIRADPEGAEEHRRLANARPGTTTTPNRRPGLPHPIGTNRHHQTRGL